LKALAEMLAAAGVEHPSQLRPEHLVRRVSVTEVKPFSALHVFLRPGDLLTGECEHAFYSDAWAMAQASSFDMVEPAGLSDRLTRRA
jgi:hypothetical protein